MELGRARNSSPLFPGLKTEATSPRPALGVATCPWGHPIEEGWPRAPPSREKMAPRLGLGDQSAEPWCRVGSLHLGGAPLSRGQMAEPPAAGGGAGCPGPWGRSPRSRDKREPGARASPVGLSLAELPALATGGAGGTPPRADWPEELRGDQ